MNGQKSLGLVRLDMDSFWAGNDRNNKRYNKRSEFISCQKLIATKQTHINYNKKSGLIPHI